MTNLRLAENFIIFPNKFDKFNNTGAIKLLQNGIFWCENAKILLYICDNVCHQNLVVYQF